MKKFSLLLLVIPFLVGCSFSFGRSGVDPRIKSIVERWQKINDLSYEVKILKQQDQNNVSINGNFKIQVKDRTKTRVEIEQSGKKVIFVNNPEVNSSYIYFPESNQYYQTNSFADGEASKNLNMSQRLDEVYDQLGSAYKIEGSEKINGISAVVMVSKESKDGQEKIWISDEQGVPLKYQKYDAGGQLVYDIEFDHFNFEKLDDALFVIPADAQSKTLDQLLKSYGK